jgi:prevent-host-death family protein
MSELALEPVAIAQGIGQGRREGGQDLIPTKLTNLVLSVILLAMPRKRVVRETVSLYQAKTHLSRLVDRAAEGEEIVISKSGRPRARLVPLEDTRALRVPGKGKGKWHVSKDFDDPLPKAVIRDFEGRG